jgi:phospholipase/carboxylesterase
MLEHIVLESGRNPGHSIIWLHGLGADGSDFVPIVEELNLPVPVRYLFPHAPRRPVTINGGFVMRAWYDISSDRIDAEQDEEGIRQSATGVVALIEQEIARGISAENIFLAGFSQGGAIALHTAMRYEAPLAGVLALSTYLPLAFNAESEATADSRNTPIFMAHGKFDPIVPHALGLASKEHLESLGYQIAWREYPMQHTVVDEELRDIEAWLSGRMSGR